MNALIEDTIKSGELIETGGLLPSARGFRVRRAKGKVVVTDGPFTESKEVVGGYAILEAKSKEHAMAMTSACSRSRARASVRCDQCTSLKTSPEPASFFTLAREDKAGVIGSGDGYRYSPRNRRGLENRVRSAHRRAHANRARRRTRGRPCPGRAARGARPVA